MTGRGARAEQAMLMADAATASLAVALATGAAAQIGLVDTTRARWLHHGLYAASLATVGATVATATQPLRFVPTVVALGCLARTRGRTRRHGAVAGAAALCWVAATGGRRRGAA